MRHKNYQMVIEAKTGAANKKQPVELYWLFSESIYRYFYFGAVISTGISALVRRA